MLSDIKQVELDKFEEEILITLFGKAEIDTKTQYLLRFLNVDINDVIHNFEIVMKPVMHENGLVDHQLAKALLQERSPLLDNLLPNRDFRLSEVSATISQLIKGFLKK